MKRNFVLLGSVILSLPAFCMDGSRCALNKQQNFDLCSTYAIIQKDKAYNASIPDEKDLVILLKYEETNKYDTGNTLIMTSKRLLLNGEVQKAATCFLKAINPYNVGDFARTILDWSFSGEKAYQMSASNFIYALRRRNVSHTKYDKLMKGMKVYLSEFKKINKPAAVVTESNSDFSQK